MCIKNKEGAIIMKEQLVSIIRQIISAEKYKLDAYFFCGSPVGTVNKELLSACEKYIEAADNKQESKEITEKMISELEAVVALQEQKGATTNVINNIADVKQVLENKEFLFS